MARSASKTRELAVGKAPPPWPHQRSTMDFLDRQPRMFDFGDPGIGKTRSQLEHYANRKNRKRLLVLCPKTLMMSAWGCDIEKFTPQLTFSLAYADQREEAFKMPTDVVIMNHDGVKWFFEKGKPVKDRIKYLKDFDHLVIDEVNAYKHANSQRSKAAAAIRKYFAHRAALSGTPNPNSVMELWHPALIIDDGKRLGTSYYKLRATVQTPTQIGPAPDHIRWDDKPGATQAINELLSDITIRFAFEDVMTHVPANHRNIKTFALAPRAKATYDKMEAECIVAFEDGVISAVHAASLRTKLLQIASGAVYDGAGGYKVVDTARYELIADLVEERAHSVVFFNWTHQRDQLTKEFDKRGLSFAVIDGSTPQREREEIVAAYQRGEYQTILLHPRTGAHGLTLTRGDTTIFASPIYEADLLKQAIHRIYRGAQDKVTNTIFVEAAGTVERAVYERLEGKYEQMTDLLDLMKQRRAA